MVRYSFSLLWVSALVEVRKGGKKGQRARGEKAARFGVLREEGGRAIRIVGTGLEKTEGRDAASAVQGNRGDCYIVNRTATRWQQLAAIPSQQRKTS